jgi:hypothetical protein
MVRRARSEAGEKRHVLRRHVEAMRDGLGHEAVDAVAEHPADVEIAAERAGDEAGG